jgi:hypothetical protein
MLIVLYFLSGPFREDKNFFVLVIELYISGGDWASKFPKITSGTFVFETGK